MSTLSHPWAATAVTLLLFLCYPTICADVYINHFAVRVTGGHEQASKVATEIGMRNLGQIGSLEDHYLFEFPHRHRRSASPSLSHHHSLGTHTEVLWFQQQVAKSRQKRDFRPTNVSVRDWHLSDPYWPKQWYLHGGAKGEFDMNVKEAWRKGYTGKNVVVSILDDGIEMNHPDLVRNYDPYASHDVNDGDNDPTPRYEYSNQNRHGTRCAGEVAAEVNNTFCGVGIAPDAGIGGVRMLDGTITDSVEAASLSFNRSHIDIYSVAWGPDDDGRTVDGPGVMTQIALKEGALEGRNGKGSIFVWASGNGGRARDSCSCDGYANSIYVLTISSVTQRGLKPWYLEECPATLASTYSSGGNNDGQVSTTDLRRQCTDSHTGTSASAPLASGIIALMLQANPELTWRDVQYITLMTARSEPIVDGQWLTNGVGRKVSLRFGYGLMDASAMVDLALVWTNVPPRHECVTVSSVQDQPYSPWDTYRPSVDSDGCQGKQTEVNYLEHVQVRLSLQAQSRGDVLIHLISPNGTKSKILPRRPRDIQLGGFDNFTFMSVQFWGENPTGKWVLEIDSKGHGILNRWSLILHGTKDQPIRLKNETQTTSPTPPPRNTTTPVATAFCHPQCVGGCAGETSSDCFRCKMFRMSNTMECVENCPSGFYASQMTCLPCDQSCATCKGPTPCQCLSCRPGMVYDEELNICYPQCRPQNDYTHVKQNLTKPSA